MLGRAAWPVWLPPKMVTRLPQSFSWHPTADGGWVKSERLAGARRERPCQPCLPSWLCEDHHSQLISDRLDNCHSVEMLSCKVKASQRTIAGNAGFGECAQNEGLSDQPHTRRGPDGAPR